MTYHPISDLAAFVGPPLDEGPLPALFYFALSAEDSLKKKPFNQPVKYLEHSSTIRIFSVTLPAHENHFPPEKAMEVWKERMTQGEEIIPPFIEHVKGLISEYTPYITTCGVAGLSRGAFIACHVAAVCPEITHILGYAPLTRLDYAPHLNLETLTNKLSEKKLRFYMGNNDTRTGTENAFAFIHKLAKEKRHSAPVEFILGPSIGYQGHGTSTEVFHEGARWIQKELIHE
ncbi:MAG: hypothetical protein KDK76_04875 [Chlamydiia bacterium]|nr:hypothetical protein [Chlamydiia bacterium]